jgi:uncharacterized membrane protein YheB (UPF0754 family)
LKYILGPLLCAFIGWFTNYLAIKMLFHPRKPKRILGWTLQGLFPKRQAELADLLGEVVEKELVNHEDIQRVIQDPAFHRRIRSLVDTYVSRFLQKKLSSVHPLLASLLQGRKVMEKIKDLVVDEVERFIPDMLAKAAHELETRFEFSTIVRDKIAGFSIEKLENVLFQLMKREFRFIEVVGGVLGLLVGTVQSVYFYFLS